MIIIILSLRVGRSKNKNTDHQGKETCAYKKDHISLLCDSTMSSALNFCFLSVLLQRKRKRSYKKKNKYWKRKIFIYEISIIILICQKLGSVEPVKQKIQLPSPYSKFEFFLCYRFNKYGVTRWTSSFNTWPIYQILRIRIFVQNPTVTFAHLMPLVSYNFRKTLGIIRIYLKC